MRPWNIQLGGAAQKPSWRALVRLSLPVECTPDLYIIAPTAAGHIVQHSLGFFRLAAVDGL